MDIILHLMRLTKKVIVTMCYHWREQECRKGEIYEIQNSWENIELMKVSLTLKFMQRGRYILQLEQRSSNDYN